MLAVGLLWGALAATAGCVLASIVHASEPARGHHRRAERMMGAAAALLVLASLARAWRTAPADADDVFRWATEEGFPVLWATGSALVLWATARGWRRKRVREGAPPVDALHPVSWTLGLGGLLCTALVVAALRADPLPRGVHRLGPTSIPLALAALSIAVLLAGASVAFVVTRRREWADVALPWARWGLLAAWMALLLDARATRDAAGRFWTWSDAQVADLTIVLLFVVVVHGLIYHRKRGSFAWLAPAAAIGTLLVHLLPTIGGLALPRPGVGWTLGVAAGLGACAAWAWWVALAPKGPGLTGGPRAADWTQRWGLHAMVYVGMVLVAGAAAFLVGVQAARPVPDPRPAYDAVAAGLAVPFLAVLGFGLGSKALGAPRSLLTAGTAVAAGGILAYADPSHGWLWLALPVAVFALVGAFVKLYGVTNPTAAVPLDLRVAGGALLAGGILAISWWSNNPAEVDLGPWSLAVSPWAPWFAGAGGLLGVASAVSCLRREHWGMALVGPVALVATLAPPAAVAGVVGLVVVVRRKALFPSHPSAATLWAAARRSQRDLRKSGVYLVHVGIVFGMAGYGAVHLGGASAWAANLAWGGAWMVAAGALVATVLGGARFETARAKAA